MVTGWTEGLIVRGDAECGDTSGSVKNASPEPGNEDDWTIGGMETGTEHSSDAMEQADQSERRMVTLFSLKDRWMFQTDGFKTTLHHIFNMAEHAHPQTFTYHGVCHIIALFFNCT